MKLGTARGPAVVAIAALVTSIAAGARAEDISTTPESVAAGTEVWASTDSDGSDVLKLLVRGLWRYDDREKYTGLAVEQVWFNPSVGADEQDQRIYLDAADKLGPEWRWRARIGTDGDTLVGSAEIRRADWAQSVFVEREIVETDQGLRRGIYYTFAGASADLGIDENNTLALSTGLQAFSGRNERLHFRARFVHAVRAVPGLSAHLDTRYYHSTHPGGFDYFSPRNFVRVVPLAQFRRFTGAGWMFLAAGGLGGQRNTGTEWSIARFGQLRAESPRNARAFDAFAEVIYTNDSLSGGTKYDYLMGRAGVTVRF
ncbi:hypothetical protein N0B51_10520 [Tsuneonella sp. YG55]|uniref:Uncharacterized protein n=1 Tax=Tsuneonella litorea TaxID=2976475 RepID=A0A9X3AN92_9SPHN|nr:hypothetical protein [Tsuneonella litorea]MCT2559412.1 hypothetical protein [Tsuneonella litorea]